MLLMGKSTISMTIFNSKLLVITRGYDVAFHKSVHVVPSLGGCNSCRLTSEKHGKNSDVHSKCRESTPVLRSQISPEIGHKKLVIECEHGYGSKLGTAYVYWMVKKLKVNDVNDNL